MSHPIPDHPDPTGLHALVAALEVALTKARSGDLIAYGAARSAARDVEVAARRLDVALGDESWTAQRNYASAHPRQTP